MEYQVRFEEVGVMAGPRAVLYGIVEAEGPEEALLAAVAQLAEKLGAYPLKLGFEPKAVWGEREGVVQV